MQDRPSDANVGAVVLAAGLGRRFGATKQLAPFEDRPLVLHVVAAALEAGCVPVVVVLGHDAVRVTEVVATVPHVSVVMNRRYREGQATSLRAGVEALPPGTGAAVVLLGDQPLVEASAIRACVELWRSGAQVVRARYADRPGHPVLFDRSVWPRLGELRGDVGARAMLRELPLREVAVPGRAPLDVDDPEDLVRLRAGR